MRREASPESRAVERALNPFVSVSAVAASVLMVLVGLLFLVPLGLAERRAWTGGGATLGIALLAPVMFAFLVWASRQGIRRQLRPLAEVGAALLQRIAEGEPRARGRLRRGWGASLELALCGGGALRVVAARGRGSRPDLYLVAGEREYRFRDPRAPLGELDEALRAVGLG